MTVLVERAPLHVPELHWFEDDGILYVVDGAAPNWVAVEPAGRDVIETIARGQGSTTFGALVVQYVGDRQLERGKAWVHVHDFLHALDRAGMLSDKPFVREAYPGRAAVVSPRGLRELRSDGAYVRRCEPDSAVEGAQERLLAEARARTPTAGAAGGQPSPGTEVAHG